MVINRYSNTAKSLLQKQEEKKNNQYKIVFGCNKLKLLLMEQINTFLK